MEMNKAESHPIRRYFNFYSLAVSKLLSCMYNISLNLCGKNRFCDQGSEFEFQFTAKVTEMKTPTKYKKKSKLHVIFLALFVHNIIKCSISLKSDSGTIKNLKVYTLHYDVR